MKQFNSSQTQTKRRQNNSMVINRMTFIDIAVLQPSHAELILKSSTVHESYPDQKSMLLFAAYV